MSDRRLQNCCLWKLINIWASSQENQSSRFATRVDSNQPAQPQKLASLKFWFWQVEVLYYSGCEQTDLHLCVRIWHKQVCSWRGSFIIVLFQTSDKPRYIPGGMFSPTALGRGNSPATLTNVRQEAANMRRQNYSSSSSDRNYSNMNAADALKAMMRTGDQEVWTFDITLTLLLEFLWKIKQKRKSTPDTPEVKTGLLQLIRAGSGSSGGWARFRSSGPATFFCGDWSWNHFYGHFLPTADSSRAVVIYWWKDVHLVLVNHLGSLPRNSVVRFTDCLDMTIVVDGHNTTNQTNKQLIRVAYSTWQKLIMWVIAMLEKAATIVL